MLSVCMIVKNESETLKRTLPQVVKCASEVIMVDTGSTDDTVKVAQELGAKVFHFKWINDFAAARNYSLSLATQPWILWLDADECLREEDLKKLISILEESPSKVQGYELIISESPWGETKRGSGYSRVKVFRNHSGIRFVRPINEQLIDKDGRVVSGEKTDIVIYHWGKNLAEEKMGAKRERYIKLYEGFLQKRPDDPYVLFLYGNLMIEDNKLEEAVKYYARVWENGSSLQVGLEALMKKAELELRLKRFKEALADAKEILAREPKNPGARNTLASILLGSRKEDVAIELLEEMLGSNLPGFDLIREQVIPRTILAKAYELKGDTKKSKEYEKEADRLKEEIGVNSSA